MIEVKDVSIHRDGVAVIEHISFTAHPGNITAIIGPNGVGKSSLSAALSGDIPIASGSISIGGAPLENLSITEAAQLRAVVPQSQRFALAYTVREILEMAGTHDDVQIALEVLEIDNLANRFVSTLSGGEQQRVSIACALSQSTPILIADEPLASQDAHSVEVIKDVFRELAQLGSTIIFVAHIPRLQLEWVDQIIEIGN